MLRAVCRHLGLSGLALALGLLVAPARAQDLEAGKTPQQLFASSCSACHKSPQGLAKGRSAGAVAGFLTQHYTTGRKPATDLAAYLVAAGDAPKSARERDSRRNARGEGHERTAAVHAEEAPPSPAEQKAEERRARRAEERKEKERKAHEPRATDRPPGLEWVPGRGARSRRGGHGQEPVSVWSDPDPVVVSREPVPLFHDRALSRAHDERQARAHEERVRAAQPAPAPAAAPAAAPPPAAPPPAAVAAVSPPGGGAAPAPQPESSAAPPAPAAPAAAPATPAPEEAPGAAVQPAAGASAAAQPFAAPLP